MSTANLELKRVLGVLIGSLNPEALDTDFEPEGILKGQLFGLPTHVRQGGRAVLMLPFRGRLDRGRPRWAGGVLDPTRT